MKNIINVLQSLNNLKYVKRVGPNLFAGIPSEDLDSIGEHTFRVCSIVTLLGSKLREIDIGSVLQHALVHDWGESIIGDIPSGSRSYKTYFEEDIRIIHKKAEIKATNELLKDGSINLPTLSSVEESLLNLADVVSIVLELTDLRQKGHTHNWIEKMFEVQMGIIKDFDFDFIDDLVIELKNLFLNGMDNKYLTKATSK